MTHPAAADSGGGIQAALRRLLDVTEELADLHTESAEIEAVRLGARLNAWMAADEDTITGRDRASDYASLTYSQDLIRVKGKIAAASEEKDYLLAYLNHHA